MSKTERHGGHEVTARTEPLGLPLPFSFLPLSLPLPSPSLPFSTPLKPLLEQAAQRGCGCPVTRLDGALGSLV